MFHSGGSLLFRPLGGSYPFFRFFNDTCSEIGKCMTYGWGGGGGEKEKVMIDFKPFIEIFSSRLFSVQ